jgi:hypothetical protein
MAEDKGKDKINDDVPCTKKPHSIRRSPICHHCDPSGHVRPQCSLLKAQKAKAKTEVPRQAYHGTRPLTQHQTPWYQALYHQAPRYQAHWSHTPRYQASQHQRPQQLFVLANHSGKSKHSKKVAEGGRGSILQRATYLDAERDRMDGSADEVLPTTTHWKAGLGQEEE